MVSKKWIKKKGKQITRWRDEIKKVAGIKKKGKQITRWRDEIKKVAGIKKKGKQITRWRDEIKKVAGINMGKKSTKQKTVEDIEGDLCQAVDFKQLMMMTYMYTYM